MRKDYYRDLWTFIAPGRALRPFDPDSVSISDSEGCFFCPGNEDQTPPEIDRAVKNGSWQVRVFPNKFPITGGEDVSGNGWKTAPSHGYHEVIVETPDHYQRLSQVTQDDMVLALRAFNSRIQALEADEKVGYVSVFKNQGREAGASLNHSHTQVLAISRVPARIKEKADHSREGNCIYCKIAGVEADSPRLVFETESFIAFCPFAPRFTHELWIVAKDHRRGLGDLSDAGTADLASMLLKSLDAIEKVSPNYNMMLYYGPRGTDFHLHIELVPRIPHQVRAGFELGTDFAVITTPPEETARFLKG